MTASACAGGPLGPATCASASMLLLQCFCTWLVCTTGTAGSINGAYPEERKFPFDQVCGGSFACIRSSR